jgi:hypothetical protein
MESVIMSEFEFVKEIPRVWRDHEKYAEAAKANPGEFLKLPCTTDLRPIIARWTVSVGCTFGPTVKGFRRGLRDDSGREGTKA